MNGFCLKEGQGLKALAAHPHPNCPQVPPRASRLEMGLWKVLDSCRQSFISTTYLQPVNVAFVDVTKAFDPVSDHSLLIAAARLGVPPPFLTYLSSLYGGAQTVLGIGPERSSPSNVVCGVRHGDPLSPHLFNALIDWVIDDLEPELGVLVGELRVDCGAFANHVVLFASSPAGFHWGSLFDDLSEAVPAVRIGTLSWIVRQVSQSMHRCRWQSQKVDGESVPIPPSPGQTWRRPVDSGYLN